MKNKLLFIFITITIFSCDKTTPELVYNKHILPSKNKVIQRIAFGSGCKQNLYQGFWGKISEEKPDLWIWGGDNIYSDTEDRNILKLNYSTLKKNSFYQNFIKTIPVIGIWDDHDYGARDSGNEYILKEESKEEFMNFFDIPQSSAIRNHKGIYTSYELGESNKKIKFFMLDNRTFKTELTLDNEHENWYIPDSTGTVLGQEQWLWLENEIKNSDAKINIFVSGIQIIPDEHIFEKWGNFPNERKRFIDLLKSSKVKNPIILSGDRHFAEFSKIDFDDNLKVIEFTSSGMTHNYKGVEEKNIHRVGQLFDGKNFGVLEINWTDENSVVIDLIIYDINGEFISKLKY